VLEGSVVVVGLLLGGRLGLGTVAYALAIGPLVQRMLPWAIVELPGRETPAPTAPEPALSCEPCETVAA